MKKFLIFLIISLAVLCKCDAQKTPPVKNIYLVKVVQMAGNIAVDEKGNQISPSQFVSYEMYVEASAAVQWDRILINNKAYQAATEEISEKTIEAGRQKPDNSIIRFQPDKGYRLFRLSLNETEKSNTSAAGGGVIKVQYYYKKKLFTKTISRVIELNMPPGV